MASIQARVVAKQYEEALADLEAVLQHEPDNTDALYMSAVCRRYRREFDAALAITARLKSLTPENGRAYQEEGHAYRDSGKLTEALLAYATACRLN
ncbi:MAG: tetratricopeptide repeat protein, partial [Gemmatimonadota bacterium]|nr:tetratricopeptide repeat protein [Gemmatimonadota bacterium]